MGKHMRAALAAAIISALMMGTAYGSVTVSADASLASLSSGSHRRTVPLPADTGRLFTIVDGTKVDLTAALGRVAGMVGRDRLTVSVTQKGAGISVEGKLGRGPVNLDLSASAIRGAIGPCDWLLKAAGDEYRGTRQCGPSALPELLTLTLPAALRDATDLERATAVLGLLAPPRSEPTPALNASNDEPPRGPTGSGDGRQEMISRFGFAAEASGTSPAGTGAQVTHVTPGSRVAAEGLREGMIIVRAGAKDITGPSDLRSTLLLAHDVNLRLQVIDSHTGARRFIPLRLGDSSVGVGGSGSAPFEPVVEPFDDIDDTPTEDPRPLPTEILR